MYNNNRFVDYKFAAVRNYCVYFSHSQSLFSFEAVAATAACCPCPTCFMKSTKSIESVICVAEIIKCDKINQTLGQRKHIRN